MTQDSKQDSQPAQQKQLTCSIISSAVLTDRNKLTYTVPSSKAGASYSVTLLAHGGTGYCTCADWLARRWPVIRDGGKAYCKHVKIAREAFLLDELAKRANDFQK